MRSRARRFLPALARRGWLLLVCAVAVAAVAHLVSERQGTISTAEAILAVPAGEGEGLPGNAQQAVILAQTYTALIPVDDAVLQRVAAEVQQEPEAIDDALTATNVPDTAVIRVAFEHSDERLALRGAEAATEAVTGADPAASVGDDVLQRVREPQVVAVSGTAGGAALPIGVVLGICLGAVLLVAWERIDPHVDDSETLAREIGAPSSALSELPRARAAALLERWHSLGGRGSSALRVTLVAAAPGTEPMAEAAARRLAHLGQASDLRVRLRSAAPVDDGMTDPNEIELVVAGVPGTGAAGEALAAEGDLTVLVVRRGTNRATLRPRLAALEQFGVSPQWGLLVSSRDARALDRDPRDRLEPVAR